MKVLEIKTYPFEELSDKAKEKAISNYRNNDSYYAWQEENRESMEKFAKMFPIEIRDWSYRGRGEGVNFYFTCDDCIEELSGLRLYKYIWNNYGKILYKGKFYGTVNKEERAIHKRISPEKLSNGKYFNAYHSGIILDNSCVLTGYCMDDSILEPIYKFLEKPDNRNFKDLLEDCFDSWIKACNADIDWQNSEEYITEEIEANEYYFINL